MESRITGLSHAAIRVTDLERSRRFYTELLGFPPVFEAEDIVVVQVGSALLGIRGAAPDTAANDRFDPFRVGLDHLAFAAETEAQLHEMQLTFDAAGVRNDGVQDDSTFNAKALVFYDPDGIALELYVVAATRTPCS